jgi:hypothetical protein
LIVFVISSNLRGGFHTLPKKKKTYLRVQLAYKEEEEKEEEED